MISLLRSRQSLPVRLFLFFVCCSSKIFDTTGEEASEASEVVINPDGRISESSSSPLDHRHHQQGVDFSWPSHHHGSEFLLDHQKDEYLRYVEGCSKQMRQKEEHQQLSCHKYEQDRMDMNLNQPKMMGK
jgi:hypothetical protein